MMRTVLALLLLAACSRETATPPVAKTTEKPPVPAAAPAAPAAPTAALVAPGQPAPAFEAPTTDGKMVKLADFAGKPVVLYFYPKDDTPGCTAEAKAFTASRTAFDEAGAQILGVSMDSVDSHKTFTDKYGLSFPLIADTAGKVAAAYGVDTSRGYAKRTTFVIGPDGKIFQVFPDVKVDGHEAQVLDAVKKAAGKG